MIRRLEMAMKLVRKNEDQIQQAIREGKTAPTEDAGKTVEVGKKDYILVFLILLLLLGYARVQPTFQELLAYLGVSTTGGGWGMIGGSSSSK